MLYYLNVVGNSQQFEKEHLSKLILITQTPQRKLEGKLITGRHKERSVYMPSIHTVSDKFFEFLTDITHSSPISSHTHS